MMPSRCTAPSEKQRQREIIIPTHQHTTAFDFSVEPCTLATKFTGGACVLNDRLQPAMRFHSPLVYERELAVNGAARDKLGGLDVHVSGGLVGAVREEAAHHHQAGETGRFFVRGLGLRVQLAA